MESALLDGSFDPPTLGHLNIIERGSHLFKKLYVGIAENPEKAGIFTVSEKVEMLKLITEHLPHVEIIQIKGLVAHLVKQKNIDVFIRAVRSVSDFEHEVAMAAANKILSGHETLLLSPDAPYAHISSTLVREIMTFGGNLKGFVPEMLLEYIQKKAISNTHKA
jgi:pantetheine-phosphate adenylyltransferase